MKIPNNKGVAVVMALSVMLIMASAALQLHSNERDAMLTAAAMRDRSMVDQMTISGVHLAMAVLVKDRLETESDSVLEDWASEEAMKTMTDLIPFDQGTLSIKITDEMSKLQINALIEPPKRTGQMDDDAYESSALKPKQEQMWRRLADKLLTALTLLGDDVADMDETNVDTIIHSMQDWLDKDDFPSHGESAESDYYENLDPPYECKNGPVDHISEVRLIKGITPELFNGLGELGGLSDHVTVYGAQSVGGPESGATGGDQRRPPSRKEPPQANLIYDYPGLININTAEAAVLSLVRKEGTPDLGAAMVQYRTAVGASGNPQVLNNSEWYKEVGADLESELITISSDFFRIIAKAELNGVKATTTAVVHRTREKQSAPMQCKVLNWKTE